VRAPVSVVCLVKDSPQIGVLLRLVRDYVRQIVVISDGIACPFADIVVPSEGHKDAQGRLIHFSAARMQGFRLATEEVIVWADSDDEIAGLEHLASEVEALRQLRRRGRPVLLHYDYEYAYDELGHCVRHQMRERMILREDIDAFEWRGRNHELLEPKDESRVCRVHRTALVWKHRNHDTWDPQRNLEILRLSEAEEGAEGGAASSRTLYCIAKELTELAHKDPANIPLAVAAHVKFLGTPSWGEDRAHAMQHLFTLEYERSDLQASLHWALAYFSASQGDTPGGIETSPTGLAGASKQAALTVGAAYHRLAARAWAAGDEKRGRHDDACAVRFLRMGFALPDTLSFGTHNPHDTLAALVLLQDSLIRLGRDEEALEVAAEGVKKLPGAVQFERAKDMLLVKLAKKTLLTSLERLHAWGQLDTGQIDEVAKALNRPAATHVTQTPKSDLGTSGKLDIILACGNIRQVWTPEVVDRVGVGGSETAACDWARGMRARGHRVRVFTSCGPARIYGGVEYHATEALAGSEADVLVAWRNADLLLRAKAPKKYIWAHDTRISGAAWSGAEVVALTRWHKETLLRAHPFLGKDEVRVIGSSIRLEDFQETRARRPRAAVCMSAHERYLLAMIDLWPRIRAAVPDATLDLFYGYDDWKRSAHPAYSEHIKYFDRKKPELEAAGVTFHPRLPPKEVAAKLLESSVYLYPTAWPECWPAVVAQAQAAGLYCATSKRAGMAEMFADSMKWDAPAVRLLPVSDSPYANLDPAYQTAFAVAAVAMLRRADGDREGVRSYARATFSWDKQLDAWEALFGA
jgi:glycosyltransferase involved in cell wall biosynthesis